MNNFEVMQKLNTTIKLVNFAESRIQIQKFNEMITMKSETSHFKLFSLSDSAFVIPKFLFTRI